MLALFPHMHLRGKAFRYTAIYPDGKQEMLLDVPHYDFNWQNTLRVRRAEADARRARGSSARPGSTTRRTTWPIPIRPRPSAGAIRPGKR